MKKIFLLCVLLVSIATPQQTNCWIPTAYAGHAIAGGALAGGVIGLYYGVQEKKQLDHDAMILNYMLARTVNDDGWYHLYPINEVEAEFVRLVYKFHYRFQMRLSEAEQYLIKDGEGIKVKASVIEGWAKAPPTAQKCYVTGFLGGAFVGACISCAFIESQVVTEKHVFIKKGTEVLQKCEHNATLGQCGACDLRALRNASPLIPR